MGSRAGGPTSPGGDWPGGRGIERPESVWSLDTVSWLDQGGDVSWRFARVTNIGKRWVRSGVRVAARPLIMAASGDPLGGNWTAPLMAYAAAAATLAPPAAEQAWVSPSNFAAVREVVRRHRRCGAPLFRAGTLEDALQFCDPHVARPQD